MTIQTIGVIGAGTMGNGIAQICAAAGYRVLMLDINDDALERGLSARRETLNAKCQSKRFRARKQKPQLDECRPRLITRS